MTRFNLSEWAVNNRAIAVFFMLVCLIGGLSAYQRLGREEDPDFSIQTMVVQASWPGASVADTLTQLTDRLEKKLEETPNLDYLKSYTKPGQATIFVNLKVDAERRDRGHLVPGPQEDHDIQMTLAEGRGRALLQRRVRRRLRHCLRHHLRRLHAARGARLRRDGRAEFPCARRTSARSRSSATRTRRCT